jgi:hypothetical protein
MISSSNKMETAVGLPRNAFRAPRRGYSLVELLVVCAISVLLMTVLLFIYSNALKVYRDSHGMMEVLETARILNRDLRDYLGNVTPVPGNWVNPATPGGSLPVSQNFAGSSATPDSAIIDENYTDSTAPSNSSLQYVDSLSKKEVMARTPTGNEFFKYSQYSWRGGVDRVHFAQTYGRGAFELVPSNCYPAEYWGAANVDSPSQGYTTLRYPGLRGWWMPGFFGERDGGNAAALAAKDILAGSFGWPRPDYRMDINLDDPAGGRNCACWFYAENRKYHSPLTLALDNANLVLVSLKFSAKSVAGREQTQLSILRHQVAGFDIAERTPLIEELALGNMLRAIKITPYYLDAGGQFLAMDDAALGCSLNGSFVNGGGKARPRCFDVEYTLRNSANQVPNKFAIRIYCEQTAR